MADDLGREDRKYLTGVSIGQPNQRTTLALIERHELVHHADPAVDWDAERKRWRVTVEYSVVDVTRPDYIEPRDLVGLIRAKGVDSEMVIVDATRVGIGAIDGLRKGNVLPVRLTDQAGLSRRRGYWDVPKLDVVAALAEAAGEGRITAPNHEWVGRALASFEPAVRGEADDVVYAVACAIWWGRRMRSQVRQPPPPRLPLPKPEPLTFDQALAISKRERQKRRTRI